MSQRTAEERRADAERRVAQRLAEKEKRRTRERQKKREKRSKFKTISIRVPSSLHSKLKKRAKSIGCSVSSLVKNYIHNGLEGVVYTESYRQTATVSKTVEHERKLTAKGTPAGYAAPAYFAELKAVIEKRKRKVK